LVLELWQPTRNKRRRDDHDDADDAAADDDDDDGDGRLPGARAFCHRAHTTDII
jgi:hypothetical protein